MTNGRRVCGECSLCCKVFDAKVAPGFDWCQHCLPGGGCAIYYTGRPYGCAEFYCQWLEGNLDFEGDEWKPSACKMVATYDPEAAHGLALYVDRDFPNIWRSEPYYSHIKQLASEEYTGQVIIHVENRTWLVRPNCDIEIGADEQFAVVQPFPDRYETIVFKTQEEYFAQVRQLVEAL